MKKFTLFLFAAILMTACSGDDDGGDPTSCGTVCSVPLRTGETPGAIPASLVGKTFNLTYKLLRPGGPIPDGATAKAELTADKLIFTYDNKCVTMKNPHSDHAHNAGFRDNCVFNLAFEVSEVDGELNEINVGSLDGDFYGQFKE